jgi:predicted NodU family carbamoyl transferase
MKLITIYNGHNATVGFFDNGKCKLILHEEKFNNIKNYTGFPVLALEYVSTLVNFKDINFFVFAGYQQMMLGLPSKKIDIYENASQSNVRKIYNYLEYKTGYKKLFTGLRNYILTKKVTPKAWNEIGDWFKDKYNIEKQKLYRVDHHIGHALTPVYFYNLTKKQTPILLLTMDGAGDNSFSKVCVFRGGAKIIPKLLHKVILMLQLDYFILN